MSLKSRIQKAERVLLNKDNNKIKDPHGKRTPFRMKAIDLWYCGEFISLKKHCKDNLEFYELLVSYTKVIEEMAARNAEIE
ncbi:hypothetical protein JMM81_21300 [Bacillus sp. V3B]|uniref:hypothetical protein n=1 Tax=Bacillus sp. V3B TaxID=2804915 RepID=UPI00210C0CF5|nr:hypothetical protein [Bacillus sp. V3B]MCQ6277407.1 hypothetical protein [Bacillus sp. V3B]